jgi:hypothetical protein
MVESNAMPVTIPTSQMPKPPLGVLGALRAGFAVVNNRFELALFPLALDLFLWLGPKLSLKPLMASLIVALEPVAAAYRTDAQMTQQLDQLRSMLTAVGNQYNLFSVLSTAPLGVPSLIASRMPESTPAGVPQPVWLVANPFLHLGLYIVFSLAGLFLGAVYFNCIAQQVRAQRLDLRQLLREVWGDWARLLAFAVLAALALGLVLVPVWVVGGLVAAFIPPVAVLLLVVSITVVMWAVFYLGFTVPAMSLQRRGLFGALWDSLRVAQSTLPATAGLYSVLFLVSLVLSAIWNLVTPDSWVMLAAVGGNALVSTAMVAAAFAFYQDRYRWWGEMRRVIQASLDRQKAAQQKS